MSARRVVVIVLLAGCAHDAPPPRSTPARAVVPATPAARSASAPAPATEPPLVGSWFKIDRQSFDIQWERVTNEGVPAPEDFAKNPFSGRVACDVLRSLDQPVPFRFQAGVEPFAAFHGTMLRLVVPVTRDRPDAVYLTSDAFGVVVHGVANAGDLELHPGRPIELDGIAVLRPGAVITFAGGAKPDRVSVAYRLESDEALVVRPRTLEATVRCADLVLDAHSFSDHGGLARSVRGQVELRADAGLSRVPGGPPFAHVAKPGELFAFAFEQARGHVRVAVPRTNDTIFGWVPEAMAVPIEPLGDVETYGSGAGTYVGRTPDKGFISCSRDVPLFAERGSSKEKVGFIHAGTAVSVGWERNAEFVVNLVRPATFWLEDEAVFLIKKDELGGCQGVDKPGR